MENVVSKKQATRGHSALKKINHRKYTKKDPTFEEALKEPFTRKKYEQAKATLERCPFPMELLLEK